MEEFLKANVTFGFPVAVLVLAAAVPGVRISAAPKPQVKSGVDRLYVIDRGDGSGPDESRWTPGRDYRRGRQFRRHGFPVRSREQGWGGSNQQAADGDQMIQMIMEAGSAIWERKDK
jgi:N-acyl homoserine lactone hydrolase